MDLEGVYRKTGGSSQTKMITQLFEKGDYTFDLLDSDRFNDICSVTSVLKTYFRSLPDPLLTFDLHERFIYAAVQKDPAQKGEMFAELVDQLPKEHYYTTRALMLHLHRYVLCLETCAGHSNGPSVQHLPAKRHQLDACTQPGRRLWS